MRRLGDVKTLVSTVAIQITGPWQHPPMVIKTTNKNMEIPGLSVVPADITETVKKKTDGMIYYQLVSMALRTDSIIRLLWANPRSLERISAGG